MESVPNCVVKRSMGVGDEVFNVIRNEETENINFCIESNGPKEWFCPLQCHIKRILFACVLCLVYLHSALAFNIQDSDAITSWTSLEQSSNINNNNNNIQKSLGECNTWTHEYGVCTSQDTETTHNDTVAFHFQWTIEKPPVWQNSCSSAVYALRYNKSNMITTTNIRTACTYTYTQTFDQQQQRRRRLRQRWRHNIHRRLTEASEWQQRYSRLLHSRMLSAVCIPLKRI